MCTKKKQTNKYLYTGKQIIIDFIYASKNYVRHYKKILFDLTITLWNINNSTKSQ